MPKAIDWRWYYAPLPEQPPSEVVSDTTRWRAWCVEQMAKRKAVVSG